MYINRWMDKEDMVYIHRRTLLSHKKEWNNTICTNMDGLREYHTKWRKSDKYLKIWNKWNYLQNRNRLRKQTYSHERGKGIGEG